MLTLRAVLPHALPLAAAIALAALRLGYALMATTGVGDPSARAVLLPLDFFFVGLTAGAWWKDPEREGLLILSLAIAVVEINLAILGGL